MYLRICSCRGSRPRRPVYGVNQGHFHLSLERVAVGSDPYERTVHHAHHSLMLYCAVASFAGPDLYGICNVVYEYLAVADLAGFCLPADNIDYFIDVFILGYNFNFYFGKQVHGNLSPAIKLLSAFLLAAAHNLTDCQTTDAVFVECFLNILQFSRTDYRFNFFHDIKPPKLSCVVKSGYASSPCWAVSSPSSSSCSEARSLVNKEITFNMIKVITADNTMVTTTLNA